MNNNYPMKLTKDGRSAVVRDASPGSLYTKRTNPNLSPVDLGSDLIKYNWYGGM
jgi:hypothetical protein